MYPVIHCHHPTSSVQDGQQNEPEQKPGQPTQIERVHVPCIIYSHTCGGVYVPCIYSHALVEFVYLVFIYLHTSGGVCVPCIYSHTLVEFVYLVFILSLIHI